MKKNLVLFLLCFSSPLVWLNSSCTQSNGNTPGQLLTDKVIVLRDGYNGYTGTRDTTIGITSTDISDSINTMVSPDIAPRIGSIHTSGLTRSFGLISFNLEGITSGMLQSGELCEDHIEVLRAELDIFTRIPTSGFVSITPLKITAPAWTETEATYTAANSTTNWTSGELDANGPVLNDTDLGFSDSEDGVTNSAITRSLNFKIPTANVQSWVCDPTTNHGLLFRLNVGNSPAVFFSREFPEKTFRPMFTVYLKRRN